MEVTFFLKEPKAVLPTPIYARLTLNAGIKFKYYLGEKITPKDWNQEDQKARRTLLGYADANALLKTRKQQMESIRRSFVAENLTEPTPVQLKALFDVQIRGTSHQTKNRITFTSYFSKLIQHTKDGIRLNSKGQPMAAGTVKDYNGTMKLIKEYEAIRRNGIALTFDNIDLDFYTDFVEFLTKVKLQSTNTIGKNIKTVITVMNDATEHGINTNLRYKSKRFKTISEKTENIFLNDAELKQLEKLDLSDSVTLEKVRDLFLIGCYTGVRFSDWGKIRPQQIKGSLIEITATKTGEPIAIPVHNTVRRLFMKYGDNLPEPISNQKTNAYLKEIGQKLKELEITASKQKTKGGFKITENVEKWQLLTTHTARRSFATNEYLAGTEIEMIKAITGHKTEKAFMQYIKVTNNEQAKRLQLIWNERQQIPNPLQIINS